MNEKHPPRWHQTIQGRPPWFTLEQYSYRVYSELFGVYKAKVWIRAVAMGSRIDENPDIAWQYVLAGDPTGKWADMPNAHTLDEAKATAIAIWRMS